MPIRPTLFHTLMFCIAISSGGFAAAQTKSEDGAEHAARAEKLVDVMLTPGVMNAYEDMMKSTLWNELTKYPDSARLNDKETRTDIIGLIDTLAVQYANGIRKLMIDSHRKNFSLTEIRELERFFSSPVGKSYSKKSEAITRDVANGLPGLTQRLIDSAIAGSAELMRKREKERNL